MGRFLSGVLALLFVIIAFPVLAQTAGTAPETVAQASGETTKVVWAWGATLSSISGAILNAALAALAIAFTWLGRMLPGQLVAVLQTARAEQLLGKAIEWGINSVTEASKDKVLTVDVGNRVLAQALQYVIDNAPDWLLKWMGGPEEVAKKIWARLNLAPAANSNDVVAIASRVAG